MEALGRVSGGMIPSGWFRHQILASPKETKVSLYISIKNIEYNPSFPQGKTRRRPAELSGQVLKINLMGEFGGGADSGGASSGMDEAAFSCFRRGSSDR